MRYWLLGSDLTGSVYILDFPRGKLADWMRLYGHRLRVLKDGPFASLEEAMVAQARILEGR